jgi:hypothetical protein
MYLLFLDESGLPEDEIFAMGGIAVRADDWVELKSRWAGCLGRHSWPDDKELKWADVGTSMPPDVCDTLYETITAMPVTAFSTVLYTTVGADSGRYDEFFASPEKTYSTAVKFIAERYQRFLKHQDSHGVIVLDSRWDQKDDETSKFFNLMQKEGTGFADLDRIVDSLLLGPSHFSLGLQIADLVVGPARASCFGLGEASRRHKQLVESIYCRHPSSNEVLGVGLKYFPDTVRPEPPREDRLFNPRESA